MQQPALTQESTTPALSNTTTSNPQSEKEPPRTVETLTQPAKIQKTATEVRLIPIEKKPIQPPAATQPVRTQTQPIQQPSSQPGVTTPPPEPAQQKAKEAETTPAPMPFVAIESQPEIIKREPAQYPEIAIKMGIQGRVTVEVTVDAQGKPIQAKVVKSSSDVFNDAAVEAVMKYVFKPAMMTTGPITAKVYIPIDFRLTR